MIPSTLGHIYMIVVLCFWSAAAFAYISLHRQLREIGRDLKSVIVHVENTLLNTTRIP